ncbi:GIY-YIG nuclease family protein, partial [Xanthomonas campestris]|uniref:GIY-YIG nuclease family protein n=2 Tax=Xanthomonas campestris TaxID=339 RepID=UPI002B238F69
LFFMSVLVVDGLYSFTWYGSAGAGQVPFSVAQDARRRAYFNKIDDAMNPYYIYALKDPRSTPAAPFYIGKGTGVRAWEHIIKADVTRKGRRVSEIHGTGKTVFVTVLADDLTEHQALKLEAELISAFGTESTGGILTNSVIPAGSTKKLGMGL